MGDSLAIIYIWIGIAVGATWPIWLIVILAN